MPLPLVALLAVPAVALSATATVPLNAATRLWPADLPSGDCLAETTYAIYKPRNVLSATRPTGEHVRHQESQLRGKWVCLTDVMLDAGVHPLPGHIGRLDADTSGLILVTSHSMLNRALVAQEEVLAAYGGRSAEKRYELLLAGRHETNSPLLATLAQPLVHQRNGRTYYSDAAVGVEHRGTFEDSRTIAEFARIDLSRHDEERVAEAVRTVALRPQTARNAWHAQRRARRIAAASGEDGDVQVTAGIRYGKGADPAELPYHWRHEGANWVTRIEVVLAQGRHHQVRRLCRRAGLRLLHLRRLAVGPITLEGLCPGDVRALNREEKRGLYEISLPKLLEAQSAFVDLREL